VFSFFKRKPPAPKPVDPLEAFDSLIESLQKQGAQVRRSAATLLSLKGELARDELKYAQREEELGARLQAARAQHDGRAEATLGRDVLHARRLREQTLEARAQAEADAALLMETSQELARRLEELEAERQSARVRMSAGLVVSEALRRQAESFERVVALDAARDEVERAHALAELYRDETKAR
jgi:hypothetical protein